MSDRPAVIDLDELRRMWVASRARAAVLMRRIDLRGMTRPARSQEERAWLEAHGGSPFIEDEAAGELARAYYREKYGGE